MKIDPWKVSTVVSAAIATALLAYVEVPAARADEAQEMGVCHDQPNMATAVVKLREAKSALERAEHDKGGWRVAALEATNKAIFEADRGCAFADK